MPDNAAEVTAAGIARLAGVGRAAVSNWRRRHSDFPRPVGGSVSSPSFALPEVEEWLREQGKLADVPLRERVWQQLRGHPTGTAAALCHAGALLLLVQDRPGVWRRLAAGSDRQLAGLLPAALGPVLSARLGAGHPVHTPDCAALEASVALLRGVAELAGELGVRQAYEFLLGRHLDADTRQFTVTPPGPARLMAALAGPAGSVLDPASGAGGLLCAATATTHNLYAQEADPALAALTALRLALSSGPDDGPGAGAPAGSGPGPGSVPRSVAGMRMPVRVRAGDSLRADAFPDLAADVVLCHPPFNEHNWGHAELAYDPRWEYGFPARTESELAWVQHALARLRDGGTAVLLMPPAAASRRSGRRIRADLLRRGALRAIVALPAGTAPPYGIPLHLWVLRRPGAGGRPSPHLLLVDTSAATGPGAAAGPPAGRDRPSWPDVHTTVLDVWRDFDRHGTAADRPGLCRALPVLELLDDDVDLAPGRHLPPAPAAAGAAALAAVHDRLTATLRRTARLVPAADEPPEVARRPATTVGELARAGTFVVRAGGAGTTAGPARTAELRVLTERDVLTGSKPTGNPAEGSAEQPVLIEEGDVVVPVLGGGTVARVVDRAVAGSALGRNLVLLRPDPAALDPWFLAGFVRGTANHRGASSYASTATRLDVRRLRLPRLPLAEQRPYGERFRRLAEFEEAQRLVGRLGEQLVQGMYDGLTDGALPPE